MDRFRGGPSLGLDPKYRAKSKAFTSKYGHGLRSLGLYLKLRLLRHQPMLGYGKRKNILRKKVRAQFRVDGKLDLSSDSKNGLLQC